MRPALARGIRIIAPDRPGLGLSTRLPGRQIADWPNDVRELADALGIARFAVIGISGGGPYVGRLRLGPARAHHPRRDHQRRGAAGMGRASAAACAAGSAPCSIWSSGRPG